MNLWERGSLGSRDATLLIFTLTKRSPSPRVAYLIRAGYHNTITYLTGLNHSTCIRLQSPNGIYTLLITVANQKLSIMSYLADALKEKGNHAFREGDYHAAEDFYTQVSNQHIIISTERVRPK